jgi:mannose-6-phosphate isomerase-like protein (cupin superfamily)
MTVLKRRSFLQLLAAALPSGLFAKALPAQASPQTTPSAAPLPAPLHTGEDRYDARRVLPNGTTAFRVSTKDCRGDFFAMEHHHTSKGGPRRHLHHNEDEWFYVLEGEYIAEVGDQLHHLKAGDSVLGPRGVSHAFAFVGSGTGRLLITYAPAGKMEEYFDILLKPGRVTPYNDSAENMRLYGMELLGPPLSIT